MFKRSISIISRRTFASTNFLTHGGSVNKAGGKFAENEKAREDEFFYKLQREQLLAMKSKVAKVESSLKDEVDEIEGDLAKLKAELSKKKRQLGELKADE